MPPQLSEQARSDDRILVFIPAYNCAPQIGRVLHQFKSMPNGLFAEILVLDNRSTDGTSAAALIAANAIPGTKIQVARNRDNYGLGGSHKAAFQYATAGGFTHVVVLHGDDQGRIEDILPVIESKMHHRFDCCLGSRFAAGSKLRGYSWIRRVGNHVFNALFSLVGGRRVTDLGSGLNIFGRTVFSDPSIMRYSDDLRFNCYLLLGLIDASRNFRFFPISWSEDDQISNVKIVSQSINTLKILVQYLFQRRAFRGRDHRVTSRVRYEFDVLDTNGVAPAINMAVDLRDLQEIGG